MRRSHAVAALDDGWFARRRIDDRTWHLWEPHVHPFLRCNVWFVRGRNRAVLIRFSFFTVQLLCFVLMAVLIGCKLVNW